MLWLAGIRTLAGDFGARGFSRGGWGARAAPSASTRTSTRALLGGAWEGGERHPLDRTSLTDQGMLVAEGNDLTLHARAGLGHDEAGRTHEPHHLRGVGREAPEQRMGALLVGVARILDHLAEWPELAPCRQHQGIAGLARHPVDEGLIEGLLMVAGVLLHEGQQRAGVALPVGMGLPERRHRLGQTDGRPFLAKIAGLSFRQTDERCLGMALDAAGGL